MSRVPVVCRLRWCTGRVLGGWFSPCRRVLCGVRFRVRIGVIRLITLWVSVR